MKKCNKMIISIVYFSVGVGGLSAARLALSGRPIISIPFNSSTALFVKDTNARPRRGSRRWSQAQTVPRSRRSTGHPTSRTSDAPPRDLASLARTIAEHISHNDRVAIELMRLAATHIDALAGRLIAVGTERISLMGGLASHIEPWLAPGTKTHLVPPEGDALDGALRMAKAAADGEFSPVLERAL